MNHSLPNPDLYNVPFRTTQFNGMPYRSLGHSGLQVSAIGLGTWKFGYPETGDGSRVDEKTAFAIFDRAIELGVTFWDTANRYNAASGNSERIIGSWLHSNPEQRRNVVIATKMGGGMDGSSPNHGGLSRGNIMDSVQASLSRMGVDHIDLLYFHIFDELAPIEESLAAIEDLVRQNIIRYFAVSNFSVDQLASYRMIQERLSVRCRAAAVQNQFDIINGESKERQGVFNFCADNGIAFVPWSPLAGGLLTDRYLDAGKVGPGDRLYDEGVIDHSLKPRTQAALRQLAALAAESDLEISQLVMAYMLTMPGMGALIPSSSSVKQLESNAKAGAIALTGEQIERMRAIQLIVEAD